MNNMKCLNCDREDHQYLSNPEFCAYCGGKLEQIDVACNMCGLSCMLTESESPAGGLHGLINEEVYGGYLSTPGNGHGALDDLTRYTFSLCEFCLDWLFSKFKVPVSIDDYVNSEKQSQNWSPAIERVTNDDWRKMKEEFIKEHDKRARARNKV
jgi:hypothetical protein